MQSVTLAATPHVERTKAHAADDDLLSLSPASTAIPLIGLASTQPAESASIAASHVIDNPVSTAPLAAAGPASAPIDPASKPLSQAPPFSAQTPPPPPLVWRTLPRGTPSSNVAVLSLRSDKTYHGVISACVA
jgi:hypothetical protein